jgi:hypothetical protein
MGEVGFDVDMKHLETERGCVVRVDSAAERRRSSEKIATIARSREQQTLGVRICRPAFDRVGDFSCARDAAPQSLPSRIDRVRLRGAAAR